MKINLSKKLLEQTLCSIWGCASQERTEKYGIAERKAWLEVHGQLLALWFLFFHTGLKGSEICREIDLLQEIAMENAYNVE